MTAKSFAKFAWLIGLLVAVAGQARAQSAAEPILKINAFPAGIGRYEPGEWSSLGVHATNTSDQDLEGLISVYFGKDSQTQFARRLWVPAKSSRQTWLPIRMSENIDAGREHIEMTMMVLRDATQGEVIVRREGQDLLRTSLLTIDRQNIKTASIFRKGMPDPQGNIPELDVDAYTAVVKARELAAQSRIIVDLSDDLLPSHGIMWETLDQLILCSDRLRDDSAGLVAVREWLHRGGKVMVYVDRVSPETVAALVGHAHAYQEVDRVALDDFTIDGPPDVNGKLMKDARQFEEPVELVRVITDSTDISARVNGWPAAFWQKVGAGEILFLTLAPRGWVPPDVNAALQPSPENQDEKLRSLKAYSAITDRFFQPRKPPIQLSDSVTQNLQQQIGYRIPSRSLAAGLLVLNLVGLVAARWWLARVDRLDWLAFALPGMALAVSAILLVIGQVHSKQVPPTVAYTQLVQIFPNTGEANVTGMAALYHHSADTFDVTSGNRGFVRLTGEPAPGTTRRMIWGDNDRGSWQNVELSGSSVHFAAFHQPLQLAQPLEAVARFGPNGIEGHVEGDASLDLQNALVSHFPAPAMHVDMQTENKFAGGVDDVLAVGQFVTGGVLSDEGRRQQNVYRELLDPAHAGALPPQPLLMSWSTPIDAGFAWPDDAQQRGAALIAIPLSLQRTPSQTAFCVPATFLKAELATSKFGRSSIYDPRTGSWLKEATRTTHTRLRFPLPKQVLPARLTQATMTMKINAPSRSLLLYAVDQDDEKLLREIANPSGTYTFTVDQPEHLVLDDRGGIQFTIVVTESEEERLDRERLDEKRKSIPIQQPESSNESTTTITARQSAFVTWQIDYVRVNLWGMTE